MALAVGDIGMAVIRQTLHGQTILNTLHYRIKEFAPATFGHTIFSLAAGVAAKFVPLMKAVQSVELVHDNVTAQKIRPLPPELAVATTVHAGGGTVASGSLPTSDCAVITKRTQFAGVKYRGRMYVAGIPVSSEDNSKLAAGVLANWEPLVLAFNDEVTNADVTWQPILWHRAALNYDLIETAELRTILRTQRRRQLGVGQ